MHLGYNFTNIYYIGPVPVPAALLTVFYFFYVPYMAVSMLISFTPGGIGTSSRNWLVRILLFQFICLLPMFTFLSCDIGRVACYWIMSSLLVWLFSERKGDSRMLDRYGRSVDALSDKVFSKHVPGRMTLTVLMMCVGVVYFVREPFGWFTSSMGYRIYFIIEKYIEAIHTYL